MYVPAAWGVECACHSVGVEVAVGGLDMQDTSQQASGTGRLGGAVTEDSVAGAGALRLWPVSLLPLGQCLQAAPGSDGEPA